MPFLRVHMDFCRKKIKKVKSTVNSLRTNLKILFQALPVKRVSAFASRRLKASMTVEAAFSLPMFIFFILEVMSAINMIGAGSRLCAALHQSGNELAFSGYAYEKAVDGTGFDGIGADLISAAYAESRVLSYAGKENLDKSCIKNGSGGISFAGTSIMNEEDIIEINISYYVQSIVSAFGFDDLLQKQRYYGRAWTGYDVERAGGGGAVDDPMVYITENGTVYHTNRGCAYLNPSVMSIGFDEISGARNLSGAKYYPCETCGKNISGGAVYITNQGNSYHTSITCPGLKRTIYTVPLSQAGGRGKCSKCGQ